ncbi:MAG TPA: AAA family ATPase, partial [Gammaproteobacteria bacterium]|nr:AAA family ATPase [Gammaproteobacteria bacterium]
MPDEIEIWLRKIGLGKYAGVFAENEIDFRALLRLSEEDLKELGLPLGARRNLQAAIETLSGKEPKPGPGNQTESAATAGEAERRQLTVMFCDLAGSTELSQKLDPEDLREVNRAYQDACKAAIERYDGYVARYMGDGVLAYFGYPRAHEDDAERAIRAGLRVVDSMRELNQRLDYSQEAALGVRVGIATGPVVVGDLIGEGASQESAVVGETPNLAARLQSMARLNSILIGPGTHDLAGGRFEYEDLGASAVKGIAEPVRVRRVVAPRVVESRFEALRGRDVTPLVGRQHETGLLFERWEHAREGDGQVALLSGEPGIGKSRIVETLSDRIGEDGATRLRYQCSAHHVNSSLHPVIEQLERTARLAKEDPPEIRLEKLESLISGASLKVDAVAPLLAHLLSIPVADRYAPPEMSPAQQKEATLDALASQMEGSSRKRPVLLVFEDVHWADPTSLELLGLVISRAPSLPMLIIITFRPEYSPPWKGHAHVTSLSLSRLSRSQAVMMLDRVTGGKALPAGIRDQIIEKTDGVPLFLEELTRTVIDSGLIEDRGSHYALSGPLPALAIPSTLHDSLMARLDRSAAVREVAQTAAVIGREFSHELLAAVSPLSPGALEDALDQLTDAALVLPLGPRPRGRYVFKHALVQDAAYESLLKAKRRDLHARIARILENEHAEKAETEPELLAYHYTEAGLAEPALRFWLKAGQHDVQQCAHAEAIAHLQRGLAVIDSLPEGRTKVRNEIEFRVALGVPLVSREGAASHVVLENYLRARTLCERSGESERLYPILWGLWLHHFFNSELRRACELADRLIEIGRSRNDVALRLEAHHCQWAVRFVTGELEAALEHCEQGIRLYRTGPHHALTFTYGGHDPGVCARNVSALALWLSGFPEQASQRFDAAFALARELGHSATLADALQMVVELAAL